MANRYFIGTGNRNWNDANNWSDTSGGAGGASIPTATDNVIFDANSGTGVVTVNAIANMLDFDCSGLTSLIALVNSAYAFNIYGNWTLCSNDYLATSFTGTGYVFLKATTSVNITSNGCTRGWNRIYFSSGGGEWINQDDFNVGYTRMQIGTSGPYATWKPLSYNMAVGSVYFSYGYNRLIFTTGTLTVLGNLNITNGTYGAIFDFTNCIVKCARILFGGYYPSITFNELECEQILQYLGENVVIANKLTIKPSTNANANSNLRGVSNFIINNELILEGLNAQEGRLLLYNSTIGTPRTITCNGTIVASNVDFRDITIAGTCNKDLSAITGGSGDCGGNSGITFTPSQKQYYKHLGGGTTTFKDATKWFSDAALSVAGRVPLPQDDWDCLAGSFDADTTFQIDCPRIGKAGNLFAVTSAVNLQLMGTVETYGGLRFGICTLTGNFLVTFLGMNKTFSTVYLGIPSDFINFMNVQGSNTFNEIIIDAGRKVRFTAGTNNTIGKLTAIGTEAEPITISSSTAAQHTLTKSGTDKNTIKYCDISYSNAVGDFKAENSIDSGNNTGWLFIAGYNMFIGALKVQKMYLGNVEIVGAYLGNNNLTQY